jgi:hypothetical protein
MPLDSRLQACHWTSHRTALDRNAIPPYQSHWTATGQSKSVGHWTLPPLFRGRVARPGVSSGRETGPRPRPRRSSACSRSMCASYALSSQAGAVTHGPGAPESLRSPGDGKNDGPYRLGSRRFVRARACAPTRVLGSSASRGLHGLRLRATEGEVAASRPSRSPDQRPWPASSLP